MKVPWYHRLVTNLPPLSSRALSVFFLVAILALGFMLGGLFCVKTSVSRGDGTSRLATAKQALQIQLLENDVAQLKATVERLREQAGIPKKE